MDRVPSSDTELLHDVATPAAPRPDDAQSSAEHGSDNGYAPSASTTGHDGSSLVTTPATGRKPRAKKSTTERPKRTSQKKVAPPPTPVVSVPSAPLTRPDGTPAPVVHLAPELSPYARTGGLGEAVASLAKYQAASGIPVTVIMPLYAAVRERTEVKPLGPAFALTVGPRTETARLYEPAAPHHPGEPRIVFIESEVYFDRPGLYGDDQGDYPDNALRYALFAR